MVWLSSNVDSIFAGEHLFIDSNVIVIQLKKMEMNAIEN